MNFNEIHDIAAPYTMTSRDKMYGLYTAVNYINRQGVEGSFVECGVYKGGSVMLMALTQMNFEKRVDIHLYDTFQGMTEPTSKDVSYRGVTATRVLQKLRKYCICSVEDVKRNIEITQYPTHLFHFHIGDVVETLKEDLPTKIALLRLDTDWYESTKIELEKLYPLLASGGVLILDDYQYWRGAREATDEYFSSIGITPDFRPMGENITAVSFIKP